MVIDKCLMLVIRNTTTADPESGASSAWNVKKARNGKPQLSNAVARPEARAAKGVTVPFYILKMLYFDYSILDNREIRTLQGVRSQI